jgi:hypothetical protein
LSIFGAENEQSMFQPYIIAKRSLQLRFSGLLIIVLLLASCRGVEDIQVTGFSDFAFKGMENNAVNFSATIGVHNPSAMGFKIQEVNLKTLVEGNFIGTLSTPDKVKIKAHSDTSYSMNFTLTMANLLTGASSLYSISRQKTAKVEMQGFVKARSWFTTKKVDIKESRTVDVPAM